MQLQSDQRPDFFDTELPRQGFFGEESVTDSLVSDPSLDSGSMIDQLATGEGLEGIAPPLQIALMLGAMVLLSGALVSITSFTRIVIVLSFVRRALSTQEIPPNQVIIGLSLFLTMFVMGPTLDRIYENALSRYLDKEILASEAWTISVEEMREFMLRQTNPDDIGLFLGMTETPTVPTAAEVPIKVLIPAFIVSELKTAFIMGFCIYLPFLLIDIVVSTILMSLGMMMMPPVIVSTPCKLMLFVLVDGWHLVVYSLSQSFV